MDSEWPELVQEAIAAQRLAQADARAAALAMQAKRHAEQVRQAAEQARRLGEERERARIVDDMLALCYQFCDWARQNKIGISHDFKDRIELGGHSRTIHVRGWMLASRSDTPIPLKEENDGRQYSSYALFATYKRDVLTIITTHRIRAYSWGPNNPEKRMLKEAAALRMWQPRDIAEGIALFAA